MRENKKVNAFSGCGLQCLGSAEPWEINPANLTSVRRAQNLQAIIEQTNSMGLRAAGGSEMKRPKGGERRTIKDRRALTIYFHALTLDPVRENKKVNAFSVCVFWRCLRLAAAARACQE